MIYNKTIPETGIRHPHRTPGVFQTARLAILLLAAFGLATGIWGCETRSMRIEQNAAFFQSLPEKHQELINAGRIAIGFTQQEVYLAWGAPDDKLIAESGEGVRETWIYTSIRTHPSFETRRRYNPRLERSEYEDEPSYIRYEYVTRDVTFAKDRVSAWTAYEKGLPYYR